MRCRVSACTNFQFSIRSTICSRFYYSVFCHCSLKTFAKFYWHLCCCLLTGDAGRAGRGWHSWTNSPKLESKHHIADNVVYLFGCRNMYGWSVIPRQSFSGNARLVRCTPLWSPPHQRMGLTIIATFADGWAKLNCVCKSIIHLFPSPSRHVSRCLVDIFVHMQYVS